MDAGTADPDETRDRAGQGPLLTLTGFTGPLERLLSLARARQVDLARLSLIALVDQLAAALRGAPAATPLGQKGDWVVMAAGLLQLRSLLLLPADAPTRQAAEAAADQLRARLLDLGATQALAGWLAQRPQLGCDVFARGRPEGFGATFAGEPPLDVVEFLWASLALFGDDPDPHTAPVYQPRPFALHAAAARARIRQILAGAPEGGPLEAFLPPDRPDGAEDEGLRALRRRSAWAATLAAGLELAGLGEARLGQAGDFQRIDVEPAPAGARERAAQPDGDRVKEPHERDTDCRVQ